MNSGIGLAYGSATRFAGKLLYQVVADDPNVLDDLPPQLIVNAFGESCLDASSFAVSYLCLNKREVSQ